MKNFIIPWPSNYSGDFRNAIEFLEGIGYPPILFFLDFIFSHGQADWAIRHVEIERWINSKLDNHLLLLGEVIETQQHESVEVIREYKIYYDSLYDMAMGYDLEFEESLYELIAVLKHYFAHISLPDLGQSEWSTVENFIDLNNGTALVVFNSAIGDLINDFYTSTQIGVHGGHPVSNLGCDFQGIFGVNGVDRNPAFNLSC